MKYIIPNIVNRIIICDNKGMNSLYIYWSGTRCKKKYFISQQGILIMRVILTISAYGFLKFQVNFFGQVKIFRVGDCEVLKQCRIRMAWMCGRASNDKKLFRIICVVIFQNWNKDGAYFASPWIWFNKIVRFNGFLNGILIVEAINFFFDALIRHF